MIDTIILCGGLGTRLQETLPHHPKALAPIGQIPFLDLLLHQFAPISSRIILATGYKKEAIEERYKNRQIIFSNEESPLGTGGAAKKALAFATTEQVLILNGDSYLDFSPIELIQNYKPPLTLVCTSIDDASRFGQVLIEPNTNRILQFKEKEPSSKKGFISAGIYMMERSLLDSVDKDIFSIERDFFPNQKEIFAHICNAKFLDIGTPTSYHLAQTDLIGVIP